MNLRIAAVLLLIGYLASGGYIVGGDEQAVVRRFGAASPTLVGSGLHYDLPWPWTRIDRVNLSAVRTLALGVVSPPGGELMPNQPLRVPAYLTGDNNLLVIQVVVSYRLHPERVTNYLFRHADVTQRLRLLVESALTAAASNCGVDYLQTFGLAELSQRLTQRVSLLATDAELGVDVDQVTLERVEPPARVQADFLDVSNARSEAARTVHDARTAAEQRVAAATAEAEQLWQLARREQATQVASARGKAARFEQLVAQLNENAERAGDQASANRAQAIQRFTWDALRDSLARVTDRMVIDAKDPIELHLPDAPPRAP